MKKVLRKTYNKYIKNLLPESLRMKLKQGDSISFPIVKHPEKLFPAVYHIKDATWESVIMPEVFEMSTSYQISLYHPAQDILGISDARITPGSEIVLTKEGAVWDKYYLPLYPYFKVADSNVASNDSENVKIRKPDITTHIAGACISLFGGWGTQWAHFIAQFLPKLYYAEEAGLLDEEVTIIMPNYKDAHINQLIDDVVHRHPKCQVMRVADSGVREEYTCDKLYWIPTASAVSNDYYFPLLGHNVLPARACDILRHKVFENYNDKTCETLHGLPEKIYLVRKGGYRGALNIDEIEAFFKEQGFTFVEPHKMPLKDKVALFRNAKIIAGPHSSAWTNGFLCNHAKGLMVTPMSWTLDAFVGYINTPENCKILQVPGYEIMNGSSQMNYIVNIDALKRAYKQLMEE